MKFRATLFTTFYLFLFFFFLSSFIKADSSGWADNVQIKVRNEFADVGKDYTEKNGENRGVKISGALNGPVGAVLAVAAIIKEGPALIKGGASFLSGCIKKFYDWKENRRRRKYKCDVKDNHFTYYDSRVGYMQLADNLTDNDISSLYDQLNIECEGAGFFEGGCTCCKLKKIGVKVLSNGLGNLTCSSGRRLYKLLGNEYYKRQCGQPQYAQYCEGEFYDPTNYMNPSQLRNYHKSFNKKPVGRGTFSNSIIIDNETLIMPIKQVLDYACSDAKALSSHYESSTEYVDNTEYYEQEIESQILELPNNRRLHAIKKRKSALKKMDGKWQSYRVESYELSKYSINLLQRNDINPDNFRKFIGNDFQHVLHAESIAIIEEVSQLNYSGQASDQLDALKELILNFDEIACGYNKQGMVLRSVGFLDFCWTALDYGFAVVQGVADGVVNIANMFLHPIDTVVGIATGLGYLSVFLGELGWRYFCYVGLKDWFPNAAEKQMDQICKKICTACEPIKKYIKETPGRDIVRHSTALVTDICLGGRALKGAGKFFNAARVQSARVVKRIGEVGRKGPQLIAAMEGLNLPIVYEAVEVARELSIKAERAGKAVAQVGKSAGRVSGRVGKKIVKVTQRTGTRSAKVIKRFCRGISDYEVAKMMSKYGKKIILTSDNFVGDTKRMANFLTSVELTPGYLKHILGMDIKIEKYYGSVLREIRSGCHHYNGGQAFKRNLGKLTNIMVDENGFIRGKSWKNIPKGNYDIINFVEKTLFPCTWKRGQVVEKITESCSRIIKVVNKDGGIFFISRTSEGFEIASFVRNGKLITSYPFFDF